jgi:hypothetical protein
MPYIIKRIKDGYKVCLKEYPKVCFSNKTLSKETAIKQMRAIGMSEAKRKKK